MRDNPSMTTWLLLGGGALAAYYFYLKPRMEAQTAAAPAGAPKRDWLAEALNVVIKGTQARQQQQQAAASDAKIKAILEGRAKAPQTTPWPINPREWL
jgi:hypothetical protein